MLDACDDDALRLALRAANGWKPCLANWKLVDEQVGERVQTQRLNERRAKEGAPVERTRKLSALTHLLRDPAYALVQTSVKLQQLAHICAAELVVLDEPRSSLAVAYLSPRSAHNPGAIDSGEWALAHDAIPKGVNAPSTGQPGAAQARDLGTASNEIELRRAEVTFSFPASGREQGQVAFACDATAVLRCMLRRVGSSRQARLRVVPSRGVPRLRIYLVRVTRA